MDVYREIVEKREAGKAVVLATIVRTEGSSPREVGTKMLVHPDASISGTIGGGKFEKLVIDDCLALLKRGSSHLLKTYRFASDGPDATEMYCGGEAEVFMEVLKKPERLIIFGGGHVGRELARIAEGLDFQISVVDDREDILRQYQEPVHTILTDPEYDTNLPSVDTSSYVVIMTRGHAHDRTVLSKVITEETAYLGMIGSRSKISETFSFLRKNGIDEALLEKVSTPIGLDIGAEGPCEIAVAIAAELVARRRKTPTGKS